MWLPRFLDRLRLIGVGYLAACFAATIGVAVALGLAVAIASADPSIIVVLPLIVLMSLGCGLAAALASAFYGFIPAVIIGEALSIRSKWFYAVLGGRRA